MSETLGTVVSQTLVNIVKEKGDRVSLSEILMRAISLMAIHSLEAQGFTKEDFDRELDDDEVVVVVNTITQALNALF